MGLSAIDLDDSETSHRFTLLCGELNVDDKAKAGALKSYRTTKDNYTLEGDRLHWLACALYVSCRQTSVPTVVGGADIEGNLVSLTRILRSTKLSLLEFFKKMKKWADMTSLPFEFRNKIDHLERNFSVSKVTFEKFIPIYQDIFKAPDDSTKSYPKSRKQRRTPCTSLELFRFCWTLFIHVKGNFSAISDDLVNSFHLLLCCVDWIFCNVALADRIDLINPHFSGLTQNYGLRERHNSEPPCIMSLLCEKYEAIVIEAKQIKEFSFKPYIRKLFVNQELLGNSEDLVGVIDVTKFEQNSKKLNNMYEEYVLRVGDFDERIFLGKEPHIEIGSPVKSPVFNSRVTAAESAESSQSTAAAAAAVGEIYDSRSLAPDTPLTGRSFLTGEKDHSITPVSTATQSVGKLHQLLSGCKVGPSDELVKIFQECEKNPQQDISKRIKEMGKTFVENFAKFFTQELQMWYRHYLECIDLKSRLKFEMWLPDPKLQAIKSESTDSSMEQTFASRRLQLGECLYYKILENVLNSELKRLNADGRPTDFSTLLQQDIFHRSLFAICMEIVIYSYNSKRVFPWIIDIYDISSYYFYKVIEIVIRAENWLWRDIVKHLNQVEEMILERLVWKNDSPLWEVLKQTESIPSVEDVTIPSQLERESSSTGAEAEGSTAKTTTTTATPAGQSPIVRTTAYRPAAVQPRDIIIQSPVAPPNLADRFGSPVIAKRRLAFHDPITIPSPVAEASLGPSASTSLSTGSALLSTTATMALITDKEGKKVLIPVKFRPTSVIKKEEEMSPAQVVRTPQGVSTVQANNTAEKSIKVPVSNKPKKTGSLALFFRKVYHLSSVRLRHMCDKLQIDSELCSQIWTCLEYCFIHHVELFRDRHIDQIMMCCCYVISKVTKKDKNFKEIMFAYRLQPQSESHVYRSVLISSHHKQQQSEAAAGSSSDTDMTLKQEAKSSTPITRSAASDRKTRSDRKAAASDGEGTSRSAAPVKDNPPTPSRLAGATNSFQLEDHGEERGDLIKFYNMVFINLIRTFALKFSKTQEQSDQVNKPILSPLPMAHAQTNLARKISAHHSVYVSPHKLTKGTGGALSSGDSIVTPQTRLLYCFNKSPARDLHAINAMLHSNDRPRINGTTLTPAFTSKRLALNDDGLSDSPAKRLVTIPAVSLPSGGQPIVLGLNTTEGVTAPAGPGLNSRLQELMFDRQASRNGLN